MGKFVKGSYATLDEAKRAIDEAVAEGYDRKLVTLVTNKETAGTIPEDLGVGISTEHADNSNNSNHDPDKTLTDEVQDAYSADADRKNNSGGNWVTSTDQGYRADEEALRPYKDDINKGQIVVLIDDFSTEPGADDLDNSTPHHTSTESTTGTAGLGSTDNDPTVNGDTNTTTDHENIRLKEERLDTQTHEVQTGEVKVNKTVKEETETVEVPVKREEVTIERRPVNDTETAEGSLDMENEEVTIPVKEEQVEVTKRPVVSEEVTINKDTKENTKKVSETVRKENLDVHTDGDIKEEKGNDLNRP